MVDGWDKEQLRLVNNLDDVGLDALGEHEGIIPEWMGSDYPMPPLEPLSMPSNMNLFSNTPVGTQSY